MCDCFRKLWPTKRYTETAEDLSEIPVIVEEIQHLFGHFDTMSPTEIIRQLGFSFRLERLSARTGGLEALLLPHPKCVEDGIQFVVLVDRDVSARDKDYIANHGGDLKQAQLALIDARIAHEIGHTFFYSWRESQKKIPTRGKRPDSTEEVWCDEFAIQLLQPNLDAFCLGFLRYRAEEKKKQLRIGASY